MPFEFSGIWLESLIGFIVWLVANVVYVDMKRSGRKGFGRILAFWFGNPTTWLPFLFMSEGSAIAMEPPPDDEEALLAEIRRDRRLRAGSPDDPSQPSATQRSGPARRSGSTQESRPDENPAPSEKSAPSESEEM